MPGPLLETKLHQPTSRAGSVARPRLLQRLDQGLASRLMLLSAPAGFGKTTLLAQWLERSAGRSDAGDIAVAWVSLDAGDNESGSFWRYVVAALQRAVPEVGADVLALLQAPSPPPARQLLVALLNDLAAVTGDVVLLLDDYHVVQAAEVHEDVAFLLEHAPPTLHVVLASRADPGLPLGRLRVRADLTEVRIADLRFTSAEAAAYLNEAMGLTLTPGEVTALEGRTEGWIAALQLAALSLQGHPDSADFIDEFAGDDRYIVDYLVEEVLQRQPEDVVTFLLQTSVLNRFTAPLCDAVTGRSDGRSMLEALDRGNLFVVPLDDRRQWYRYHHLFADLLRARLLDEFGDRLAPLHRRASDWWAEHGDREEAIGHALTGGDPARAAELIELAMPSLRRDRREATHRRWMEMLPDDVIEARPVLCIGYVGALLSSGETGGVERWLDVAEPWADEIRSGSTAGMIALDEVELSRVPSWVANYRAALAMLRQQVDEALAWARRASELADPDDHLARGAASALLGIGAWAHGDLEAAHAAYEDCTRGMLAMGHVADVLGCAITLGEIRLTRGRLSEALHTFERGLQLGEHTGGDAPAPRGTADMYVGMSVVHRERNDLVTARDCLARSDELGDHLGLPQNRYRSRVARARVLEAEGGLEAASALLAEAERLYDGDFMPEVRPVSAQRARVHIRQGRLEEVFEWARDRGLSSADDLSYLREFEHVTLARALLARYDRERAPDDAVELIGLLQRLLGAAEAGVRTGTVIELLALLALAEQVAGDASAALQSLQRALELARPEGYARVFLDEGLPMLRLLEVAAARGVTPEYASLLAAASRSADRQPLSSSERGRRTPGAIVVEPLSERERDVLRLLASELAGPEIARELVVSLNTVRTHTRNIYAKLGVGNRRAAVRRAEELDLLRRHPR